MIPKGEESNRTPKANMDDFNLRFEFQLTPEQNNGFRDLHDSFGRRCSLCRERTSDSRQIPADKYKDLPDNCVAGSVSSCGWPISGSVYWEYCKKRGFSNIDWKSARSVDRSKIAKKLKSSLMELYVGRGVMWKRSKNGAQIDSHEITPGLYIDAREWGHSERGHGDVVHFTE